jgi:DNA repair exonuclease SbcCD ATPase subunit
MNKNNSILSVADQSLVELRKVDVDHLDLLNSKVDEINNFIRREMLTCQLTIKDLQEHVKDLKLELLQKKEQIDLYAAKLKESEQLEKGKHQLIEKLLNDISRYQNDISWFKRTYEKRSFFGVLKDRLKYGNKKSPV